MKKLINIFLIVISIFFITGCTADYEITLTGDKISEKLTLREPNTSIYDEVNDNGWTVRELFGDLFLEQKYGEHIYEVKSLDDNILSAEVTSKNMELDKSAIISTCYPDVSITSDEKNITFDSGKEFECYDIYNNLDTITVKLKTDHKVISTNSDQKEGNTYIWNITKDSNKQILVVYSTKSKSDYIPTILLFGGVLIIIAILFAFVVSKRKIANKI